MQDPKIHHQGTITQLCRAMSSQLRHISTIGKNLLSSNISSTCPHNMVNFRPLAAEIGLPVWGTPANFKGFRAVGLKSDGTTGRRDRLRDTWRSICHGPVSRRCLRATDTRRDTGPWRLWVKCGTAACGMRKVKCGMECAARR